MDATPISKIGRRAGGPAVVEGWLYNKRSSGKIQFLIVRDGTGYVQVVVPKAEVPAGVWDAAERATQEASVRVTGTVREEKRAPGGYEMSGTAVEILGPSPDYPITPKEHGVDFLMNLRHLWMRSSQQHAVLPSPLPLSREPPSRRPPLSTEPLPYLVTCARSRFAP